MHEHDTDPRYTGRDSSAPSTDARDPFDRKYWELHDVAVRSAETTMTLVDGLTTTTFVLQTMRVRDVGDFLFIQRGDKRGFHRFVLPPKVLDAIARQRDAVGTLTRKRIARQLADDRRASGKPSGFAAMTPAERKRAREKAAQTRREKAAKRAARRQRQK